MTDNLIACANKLSSLMKMAKWHAHFVHMVKHMNMMGCVFRSGAMGPGLLSPSKVGSDYYSEGPRA